MIISCWCKVLNHPTIFYNNLPFLYGNSVGVLTKQQGQALYNLSPERFEWLGFLWRNLAKSGNCILPKEIWFRFADWNLNLRRIHNGLQCSITDNLNSVDVFERSLKMDFYPHPYPRGVFNVRPCYCLHQVLLCFQSLISTFKSAEQSSGKLSQRHILQPVLAESFQPLDRSSK